MKKFSFNNKEKLKSKIEISSLFKNGKFLYTDNIGLGWSTCQEGDCCLLKTAVSVPKRNFKLAIDRNKLKRKIRESFRINKTEIISLLNEKKISINMIFLYTSKKEISYEEISVDVIKLLSKLSQKITDNY